MKMVPKDYFGLQLLRKVEFMVLELECLDQKEAWNGFRMIQII